MQLEKPALFPEKKGFLVFMALLAVLLIARLWTEYRQYKQFIEKPFYYTYANVLVAYEKTKGGKRYQVLKLRSEEGLTFYTTSHQKKDLHHGYLRVQLFPDKRIAFKDYLGTFYVRTKIKSQKTLPLTFKDALLAKVASQHRDASMQSFYNAIFFATPLDKTLREKVSLLGVSHLVALSGFHLGILWGLVYGLLLLLYSPVQQKFFPYRHALLDVGAVAMLCLGVYVWFVDFPPSLVRSYAMVFVGWVVLLLGMELLSFTFLATVVGVLMVLFPPLVVSLSFWFSVAGVFYIFLLLQYTKHSNTWIISFLWIPLGIFILMLPVVHYVFGVTSIYQLLSPLLSVLFVPFYPLAMLLHLLGWGGLFDEALAGLFSMPHESRNELLPTWSVLGYVALSIGAIWSKKVFYLVLAAATLYTGYLFIW